VGLIKNMQANFDYSNPNTLRIEYAYENEHFSCKKTATFHKHTDWLSFLRILKSWDDICLQKPSVDEKNFDIKPIFLISESNPSIVHIQYENGSVVLRIPFESCKEALEQTREALKSFYSEIFELLSSLTRDVKKE
jgi:hypothetical protein